MPAPLGTSSGFAGPAGLAGPAAAAGRAGPTGSAGFSSPAASAGQAGPAASAGPRPPTGSASLAAGRPPGGQFNPPARPIPAAPRRVYAGIGKRLAALIIDGVLPAAALYAAVFAGFFTNNLGGAVVGYFAGSAFGFLYAIILWAMLALKGTSPGKALLRIRVVPDTGNDRLGWGKALVRLVVRGLLLTVTIGIAGLSPLWDGSYRRRAWWDRVVDTVVVTAHPVASPRHAVPAATMGWTPPAPPTGTISRPVYRPTTPPVSPATAPERAITGPERPAGAPSESARVQPTESTAVLPTESGAVLLTKSTTLPPSADAAPPPSVDAALPPSAHEDTRLSPRRKPPRAQRSTLILDTGESIEADPSALIGRDPARDVDDRNVQLIPILDDSLSVSKTHFKLEVIEGAVVVTDRHSTNGSGYLDDSGTLIECVPGVPTEIPAGATIVFGNRKLTVRTPAAAVES